MSAKVTILPRIANSTLQNIAKNFLKLENAGVFQGFEDHHLANAYLKETLEETWKESMDILNYTCRNKFRTALRDLFFHFTKLRFFCAKISIEIYK